MTVENNPGKELPKKVMFDLHPIRMNSSKRKSRMKRMTNC
jgi:hypothetical protein